MLLLVVAACSKPSLPPLPVVDTDAFLPSIRSEVEREFAAVRESPGDAGRNGRLGMLLHAHDRLEPALVLYQRARILQRDDYRWLYLSGTVQASLSRSEEAADSFRKALERKEDDIPARLGLADALAAAGKTSEARGLYEKLTAQHPELAAAWYSAGRAYASEGNLERAAELYNEACERYPRYGAAHYALALAYRRLGRTAEADAHLAAYEKDKTGTPPREDPLLAAVRSMNRGVLPILAKAKTAAATGRLQEALELHRQALAIDPQQEQIHINLISLYGRLGQFDNAERHFQTAVEQNPNRDEAHYNYAVLLTAMKRLPDAMEAYRTTLRLNPQHAEAHNNLGYLLAQQRNYEEALSHINKALESRPNYPQAHFNAATILMQRGKTQDAIRHLEAAIRPEDPNAPRYMEALSALYRRAGDQARAMEYAQRARAAARAAQ